MGKQAVLQSSQAAGDKEYSFSHHSSPSPYPIPKNICFFHKRGVKNKAKSLMLR